MTLRALDLLDLSKGAFVLDIGCGSGISGEILTQERYNWVGLDISNSMLQTAAENGCQGDILLADFGAGLPFRAGSFDAAVSISALQWLLVSNAADQHPKQRLRKFFTTLHGCLIRGGRACLQFYMENKESLDLLMSVVKKCGFNGGIVVDNPDSSRQRKQYLLITAGGESMKISNVELEIPETTRKSQSNLYKRKSQMSRKELILHKKELHRRRGNTNVKRDSKYTGRKRRPKF